MTPADVWVMVEAHAEERQMQWEMTRLVAYTVGAYGNSDSRRFPKNPQKFLPFAWDKEMQLQRADSKAILTEHARRKAFVEQQLREGKMTVATEEKPVHKAKIFQA